MPIPRSSQPLLSSISWKKIQMELTAIFVRITLCNAIFTHNFVLKMSQFPVLPPFYPVWNAVAKNNCRYVLVFMAFFIAANQNLICSMWKWLGMPWNCLLFPIPISRVIAHEDSNFSEIQSFISNAWPFRNWGLEITPKAMESTFPGGSNVAAPDTVNGFPIP